MFLQVNFTWSTFDVVNYLQQNKKKWWTKQNLTCERASSDKLSFHTWAHYLSSWWCIILHKVVFPPLWSMAMYWWFGQRLSSLLLDELSSGEVVITRQSFSGSISSLRQFITWLVICWLRMLFISFSNTISSWLLSSLAHSTNFLMIWSHHYSSIQM